MKIVYLVAAHYNPAMFGTLLDALTANGSPVVVHIDAKADEAPFRAEATERTDVTFTSTRVDVRWGGWTLVESTLAMMRAAAPLIEPDDYVILLSGDSYPLQSQAAIAQHLAAGAGAQYINRVAMPSAEMFKPITRVSQFYLEYNPRNGKRNLFPKVVNRLRIPRNYRKAFDGRRPFAGSAWWTLTGEAVQWILSEASRDQRFVKFCRWTRMPDEFFFQTLIEASPFAGKVTRSLMFADWSRPTGSKPAVIDADHLTAFASSALSAAPSGYGSGPVLFARKFSGDANLIHRVQDAVWTVPVAE